MQRVLWEFRYRTTSIAQGIQGALLSGRGQDGVRSRSQLDNMKRAFQGGKHSGQSSKNSQSVKELRISPHYPTTVWGGFCRWGGGVEPQWCREPEVEEQEVGKGCWEQIPVSLSPFLRPFPVHFCLFSWPPVCHGCLDKDWEVISFWFYTCCELKVSSFSSFFFSMLISLAVLGLSCSMSALRCGR